MLLRSDGDAKPLSISFYLLIAAALFAFVNTFSVLAPIILSFLLTILIALALNPVIVWLRTSTGGRKGATGLVAAGIVTVIVLTCWAFFTPLKESVTSLSEVLPEYWERLQKPLIKLEKNAKRSEEKLQAEVSTEIATNQSETGSGDPKPSDIPSVEVEGSGDQKQSTAPMETNSIRSNLGDMLVGVVGSLTAVAINGAQMLVVLVTVFFGVIFMLMNPRPIISAVFLMVPERHHDSALVIMKRIGKFAPSWAGSTFAGMLSIGLLVFLLMWPILGLMDAMVLGLIAGVLEAIPFLGPTLSAVPALLLALSKGGYTPLWVLLAYIAVQALENNVIIPLIMARGMQLHAVAIIFSMLLCVAAFGVLGVLVAAPLVAIIGIVHDELYRKRFLPNVADADLDRLASSSLHEKRSQND